MADTHAIGRWARRGFYLGLMAVMALAILKQPPAAIAAAVVLTVAAVAAWLVGNWLDVRRRLEANRRERYLLGRVCPECGYNVRATPGKCTECGWGRDA